MSDDVEEILDKFRRYKEIEKRGMQEAFNQIMMSIFSLESGRKGEDLFILAKILDNENFNKLINFYDGNPVSVPSKKQRDDLINVSLCYYMKEILGYKWSDIFPAVENITGVEIKEPVRTMSMRVKRIKDKIDKQLGDIITNIDISKFEEYYVKK